MRIVDICNHYIFTDLVFDFDKCETMEDLNEVNMRARSRVDADWNENVKEILWKHAAALYDEAANGLMVKGSLDGILQHKIFDGTVKERLKAYSDEATINDALGAMREELKIAEDTLYINKYERRILEEHLFELCESAKKDVRRRASKGLSSSYVFSDEFENMFHSADTKEKLDAAYTKALEKVQGHAFEDWAIETAWIDMTVRLKSLLLDTDRVLDRDADVNDLWHSELVQKFDIREPFGGSSLEAQDRVLNRHDEFVKGCRLKKGKAVELAKRIKNLQLSLINTQAMADEYADISSHVIGLQKLTRFLKAEGSEVVLRNISMSLDGRVSSVEFEPSINEVL